MHVDPFEMERWQSLHEHHVDINLSDSGVHPLTLRELLPADEQDAVLDQRLIYTQTNGTPELREVIAGLYADGPGPAPGVDEIQVVNGGAEANFVAVWCLLEPGDEVVMMVPNYMQIAGWARSMGAKVLPWELRPDLDAGRWEVDLDQLEQSVGPRTRMIVLCNPNNPTGSAMDATTLDRIAEIAARHDAWILSDEIYRHSELDGSPTPSMWGRHDKVVITNSLSKAYGLPGLRLGWMVAPAETCERFWLHHDYTTISPGAISDLVARRALSPPIRDRLVARTRELLNRNLRLVLRFLEPQAPILRAIPPTAGAMLYLHYDLPLNSGELADRLRREKSVLLVPGDHYGMDGWLRIGFGGETEHVEEGIGRLGELLRELRS